jgi:DnaJ-class molecular chaperone
MMNKGAPDLNQLSATIGIDLESLREKYQGLADGTAPASDEEKAKAAAEAFKVLEKYKTCTKCQGTGLVKSVYNFISMESNCDECDGDGLLQSKVDEIIAQEQQDAAAATKAEAPTEEEEEEACGRVVELD